MIGQLLHAKQNHATNRIGKGRIGFPDAAGQAAGSFFRFDSVVFTILFNAAVIKHAGTSLQLS